MSRSESVAFVLILSLLLWLTGAPVYFQHSARAANLVQVSDTLTDSDLGVTSGHTIRFTNQSQFNGLGGQDTLRVTLDPDTNNFQITSLWYTDFWASTGLTVVLACGGGAGEFTLATTTENFTLTLCSGDTVATSTPISLVISATSSVITNPNSINSYVVRIEHLEAGTSVLDSGDARVAIIDDVVVTAAVATSFTFTISGVPAGVQVNGVTTSTSTATTTIGFGILPTSANSSTTAAQRLNVSTNAVNGFSVTVQQDQNLTSSAGADIDVFQDGAGTATPSPWVSPANTLGSENTYGHFGLTTDDATLPGGDEFGTALFVGNFATTSRQVFYHNGPADGTTANIGSTTVAYRIAIGSLQEAGNDYTNTLTYVATPIF